VFATMTFILTTSSLPLQGGLPLTGSPLRAVRQRLILPGRCCWGSSLPIHGRLSSREGSDGTVCESAAWTGPVAMHGFEWPLPRASPKGSPGKPRPGCEPWLKGR
jgi:hypothetical protein